MKWLMNIIALLNSAFTAVGNWLKHQTHRSEVKNTPEMIAAKKAQDEADAVARETEAVRKRSEAETRKNIADS